MWHRLLIILTKEFHHFKSPCCNYSALRCAQITQTEASPVPLTHTHTLRQIAFTIIRLKLYYGKKEVGCVGNLATPRETPLSHFTPHFLPSFIPPVFFMSHAYILRSMVTKTFVEVAIKIFSRQTCLRFGPVIV